SRRARLLADASQLVAEGIRLYEYDIRPKHVIGRDIGVRHHVRALQVASAQENVLLRAIGEDQNFPVRHAERVEQRDHLLGARLVVVEVVDDDQRILAGARIERALAGECANLPRYRLDVFASGRTEDSSAAHPLRSAARALPRATCSLLLPRLLVTARHQTTRLGVSEAQPL